MQNLHRLLRLLEIGPNQFARLCFGKSASRFTSFEIPKRRKGEKRLILAPSKPLKEVLGRLNQKFHDSTTPTPCAHGFIKERSIISNAAPHVSCKWVLNIDLNDFFPSITEKRVFGALLKWSDFMKKWGLVKQDAFLLARLCCHKGSLPQGAPTSPLLANLVARSLDRDLIGFAKSRKLTVSRYADDISFSPFYPRGVLPKKIFDLENRLLHPALIKLIERNGFAINKSKTRLTQFPGSIKVTGLVVNRLVNLPRKFTRQVRAMLHAWEKHGLEAADREYKLKYDNKQRTHDEEYIYFDQVVLGKIQFISMVRGKGDPVYLRFRRKLIALDLELGSNLKVELDDFAKRSDFTSLLKEDEVLGKRSDLNFSRVGLDQEGNVKRDNQSELHNKSFLHKWVLERLYVKLGHEPNTEKGYYRGLLRDKILLAERSFLISKHNPIENCLIDFVSVWDQLTGDLGYEMNEMFRSIDLNKIEDENKDLPERLRELLKRGGFYRLRGSDQWTIKKLRDIAIDQQQNSKGFNTMMVFAGFGLINGGQHSISIHKDRIDRILDIEPKFFELFDELRNIRNDSKASEQGSHANAFRERFYKVFKALIQAKEN